MVWLENRASISQPSALRNSRSLSAQHRSQLNDQVAHSIHARRWNKDQISQQTRIVVSNSQTKCLIKRSDASSDRCELRKIGMPAKQSENKRRHGIAQRVNVNEEGRALSGKLLEDKQREKRNPYQFIGGVWKNGNPIDVKGASYTFSQSQFNGKTSQSLIQNIEECSEGQNRYDSKKVVDAESVTIGKSSELDEKSNKIRESKYGDRYKGKRVGFGTGITDIMPLEEHISSGNNERRQPAYLNLTCRHCNKFYTVQSLDFHSKVCQERTNEEKRNREAAELLKRKSMKGPTRPPGHICYVCGRRCTKSSWTLHEKSCCDQWRIWNERLPKNVRHQQIPLKPSTIEEDLLKKMEMERLKGRANYTIDDAYDDIMLEASFVNELPLEYL